MECYKSNINKVIQQKNFKIPIYQRKYTWRIEQCEQLFDDIINTILKSRESHFFGAIIITEDKKTDSRYIVIDGQQRIATISLLLLALKVALDDNVIQSNDHDPKSLGDNILRSYLINDDVDKRNNKQEYHIQLTEEDDETYKLLFDKLQVRLETTQQQNYNERATYHGFDEKIKIDIENGKVKNQYIVNNFQYFYQRIKETTNISASQLLQGIKNLSLVEITMDENEDPQLIFESINATGLDLTEGDKIRNYLLMDLSYDTQESFYNTYWKNIEQLTKRERSRKDSQEIDGIGLFIRDFLTARTTKISKIDKTYAEFKTYYQKYLQEDPKKDDREDLFKILLKYAENYHKFLYPQSIASSYPQLSMALSYINRLDMKTVYPFLLEVFREFEGNLLTEQQVLTVLSIIESYGFRRLFCNLTTNALNKIFQNLHSAIKNRIKASQNHIDDNTPLSYEQHLQQILSEKKGKTRFPDNNEFKKMLREKKIDEEMKANYQKYFFVRLENKDTVYQKLQEKENKKERYTLGYISDNVQGNLLHCLGNLTITGYPTRKKRTFEEQKKDNFGFDASDSILWLCKYPLKQEKWTETEINRRTEILAKRAICIWPMLQIQKISKSETCNLLLEDTNSFTWTTPENFMINDTMFKVETWADVLIKSLQYLYQQNPDFLHQVKERTWLRSLFYPQARCARIVEIAPNISIQTSSDTQTKVKYLQNIFKEFGIQEFMITILRTSSEEDEEEEQEQEQEQEE
ncbi:MAG TPA: DUF262 domain-containing protein [Planctomycetota bacterium]|nr:DUF262 domain-containing protein [Planctomycetota bacterium]HQB00620.1 DUF262 domain-containing protein [Planctomycetota bacterium]